MRLLRNNRDALKNVLESFIHDPLVEWGRRGKGVQGSMSSNTLPEISSERSKEETRITLKTINDRLRGICNLGDAIRPLVSPSQRRMLPENEGFPLSVQGQVDKLIQEATSTENLAQMYIGWMPFLWRPHPLQIYGLAIFSHIFEGLNGLASSTSQPLCCFFGK